MRRDESSLACCEMSPRERLIVDGLKSMLGIGSDADMLRVALWNYARWQGVALTSDAFRLRGAGKRAASVVKASA
jgi:hypothetical protein